MSSVIKLSRSKGGVNLKIVDAYEGFEPEIEEEIREVEEEEDSEIDQEQILREKMQAEFQKGYEEGSQTVGKKLRQELNDQLEVQKNKVREFMSSIDEELKNYEDSFAKMVTSLAVAVAKKVVNREIEVESPILENVKSVSQKLIGASYIVIKVNPVESDILQSNSNSILAEGNFSKIKFEEDERIDKGGFLIESDIGNIDGRISSQLEEIQKAFDNIEDEN